jgi:hypothetical protein
MAEAHDDNTVRRVTRAVTSTKWTAKLREAAEALKAQHAAGRDGDDSPVDPIWPTPKEQLDALKHLFKKPAAVDEDRVAEPATSNAEAASDATTEETVAAEAEEVAAAMRRVDWTQVRAATSERATDVGHTMRSLADQVDWAKVTPVAAQVSSALIAAVAAGRIPVGGRLGPMVAKAITDQNNLGKRIAVDLQTSQTPMPPDFRGAIEATATDV